MCVMWVMCVIWVICIMSNMPNMDGQTCGRYSMGMDRRAHEQGENGKGTQGVTNKRGDERHTKIFLLGGLSKRDPYHCK